MPKIRLTIEVDEIEECGGGGYYACLPIKDAHIAVGWDVPEGCTLFYDNDKGSRQTMRLVSVEMLPRRRKWFSWWRS